MIIDSTRLPSADYYAELRKLGLQKSSDLFQLNITFNDSTFLMIGYLSISSSINFAFICFYAFQSLKHSWTGLSFADARDS